MLHKFSKELLDRVFSEIAKQLKKRLVGKRFSYEIIIVGGASILLNYSFRSSTLDIDCLDVNDALMNDIINNVSEKYKLPTGWINTDFTKTNSYTPKLIQYSSFYKSYSNDSLIIRTVKDQYLIAMKMVAAREYKHDYSDIFGIIKENKDLSFEQIEKAIINLYGSTEKVSDEMINFVKTLLTSNSFTFEDIEKKEEDYRDEILKIGK